jgi:hypothetical protein
MSSLEKSAGSLDGWLDRSSKRDRRRDLWNEAIAGVGPVPGAEGLTACAGERCRIRRGGGRGISPSIAMVRWVQMRIWFATAWFIRFGLKSEGWFSSGAS